MRGHMKIIERYPTRFRILSGSGAWALLYPVKLALAGVYRIGLIAARRGSTDRRRAAFHQHGADSSPRPVIVSIGNLEAGGVGKTPCALRIAGGIAERGGVPVIVSRGYGSLAQRRAPCVIPGGRVLPEDGGGAYLTDRELLASHQSGSEGPARAAETLGDETLLYRARGIPVVIDPDRGRGADLARRLFSPSHILLDDAFQNTSIRKDVEILLLDAERPFGNGHLLPLGTLREIPSAARRADIIVFTRAASGSVPPEARRYAAGKHVFFARHEASDLMDRQRGPVPLSRLAERECVLFSGIARPESFERAARCAGARPRAAFRFIDHHVYGGEDVRMMLAEGGGDAAFVTTEKDWAKAIGLFPVDAEILALRIEMRIDGFDRLLDLVFSSSS
jgi:tetraacyldisaccharide 4'-kinase